MDTIDKIKEIIAQQTGIDEDAIKADTTIEDIMADSLDTIEMLMAIEENFGITVSDEEAVTLKTISDVADFIEKKI